jgi:hypothetical protein
MPDRDLKAMAAALPFLSERFTTYKAYGQASLPDLFGPRLGTAKKLSATTLASMIFLNRGSGRFEARVLPREAQLAPAFAVCVGDSDGDGREDLFLSQNFFATQPRTTRSDAGRGLWLQGDGRGGFRPVPGQESGVKVYGEQRGAALADYDADGRVDLVVTQNGAETRLFHNLGARPGLRVRFRGSPGNPNGVGAIVRLKYESRWGPAREIHAGSGYWSQDSAVQVLGMAEPPRSLWVRWPSGGSSELELAAGAREMVVDFQGVKADAAPSRDQNLR